MKQNAKRKTPPHQRATRFCLQDAFAIAILLVLALPGGATCDDKSHDIIVEKNLFSPQRKKWLLEERQQKPPKQEPDIQKQLAQITLYGTVRTDEYDYAVIGVNRNKNMRAQNNLFMVGDFVNGFMIEDIRKKRIVLSANGAKETYEIFLNDGKKDRSVIKTALPVTVPKQAKYSRKPRQAQTVEFLKKRLRKSINILKGNKSDLVRKQAERDLKKIEKMTMGMSDRQIQDIVNLKQQYEQVKN